MDVVVLIVEAVEFLADSIFQFHAAGFTGVVIVDDDDGAAVAAAALVVEAVKLLPDSIFQFHCAGFTGAAVFDGDAGAAVAAADVRTRSGPTLTVPGAVVDDVITCSLLVSTLLLVVLVLPLLVLLPLFLAPTSSCVAAVTAVAAAAAASVWAGFWTDPCHSANDLFPMPTSAEYRASFRSLDGGPDKDIDRRRVPGFFARGRARALLTPTFAAPAAAATHDTVSERPAPEASSFPSASSSSDDELSDEGARRSDAAASIGVVNALPL